MRDTPNNRRLTVNNASVRRTDWRLVMHGVVFYVGAIIMAAYWLSIIL